MDKKPYTLRWRHYGRGGVSNHQLHDCLLDRLFRRRSKKTSKLRVTGLCAWNSPVPGEFPAQMASNAGNVSIWWRHHEQWWYRATAYLASIKSDLFMYVDVFHLVFSLFGQLWLLDGRAIKQAYQQRHAAIDNICNSFHNFPTYTKNTNGMNCITRVNFVGRG